MMSTFTLFHQAPLGFRDLQNKREMKGQLVSLGDSFALSHLLRHTGFYLKAEEGGPLGQGLRPRSWQHRARTGFPDCCVWGKVKVFRQKPEVEVKEIYIFRV